MKNVFFSKKILFIFIYFTKTFLFYYNQDFLKNKNYHSFN
jgi:hypothetical protein